MLTLSAAARAALDAYFAGKAKPSLRVYLSFTDPAGPRLDLAPDRQKADDTAVAAGGYTFLVNTLLLHQAAPLTIETAGTALTVRSTLDFSQAGGSCGQDCSHHD